MRFRMLRIVTVVVVVVVIAASVSVALVRKFVFPEPPGERHARAEVIQAGSINSYPTPCGPVGATPSS
jgi:hypothetical protein